MKIPYNLQFRIDLHVWNKLLYCNLVGDNN